MIIKISLRYLEMKLTPPITINYLDVKIAPSTHNRLRWKEYQILSVLVQRSPEAVSRTDLISQIWKGTYCSDSTINQTIKSIRQKIGDEKHEIIKTIPRIGYIIEENQMVNISFNDNNHNEPSQVESPVITAPQETMAKNGITETKKDNVLEEELYIQPIWVSPSRSRTPKSATTTPIIKKNTLINSIVCFFYKFQQKKIKILLYFFIFIMLGVFSVYTFPAVIETFNTYNQTRAKFIPSSAFIFTTPLGYNNNPNETFICKNMTVKFYDIIFDCQALSSK